MVFHLCSVCCGRTQNHHQTKSTWDSRVNTMLTDQSGPTRNYRCAANNNRELSVHFTFFNWRTVLDGTTKPLDDRIKGMCDWHQNQLVSLNITKIGLNLVPSGNEVTTDWPRHEGSVRIWTRTAALFSRPHTFGHVVQPAAIWMFLWFHLSLSLRLQVEWCSVAPVAWWFNPD